jgi:hypothetical protein
VELQAVLDKISSHLNAWKGKLMDRSARLLLINSVITATHIYLLSGFPVDKWFVVHGGNCLVYWKRVFAPFKFGTLISF